MKQGRVELGRLKNNRVCPNEEYFEKLAREMTQILITATDEGAVFRVDLRLRPEGDVGSLAKSLDDSVHYYQTRGRDWERMAFIKVLSDSWHRKQVGRTFLRRIRSFIRGEKECHLLNDILPDRSIAQSQNSCKTPSEEEKKHGM